MAAIGCESVAAIKKAIPSLRSELDDPDVFKQVYASPQAKQTLRR